MSSFHRIALVLAALAGFGNAGPLARCASAQDLDPDRLITQYAHDVWTAEDGLPQNSVVAVAQTAEGYLWFGTEEGLVRFDGFDMTVFDVSNTPEFNENTITSLAATPDSVLWIGTRGGIVCYRHGMFKAHPIQGFDADRITAILIEPDGVMWIGTAEEGLFRVVEGVVTSYARQSGFATNGITTLSQAEDGSVWIGTRDAGVVRYKSGRFENPSERFGIVGKHVSAVRGARNGSVWIATRSGALVHETNGRARHLGAEDGLPAEHVEVIYDDRQGSLWLGTAGGGLVRLTTSGVTLFDEARGLSHGVVQNILQDREGSLWIGTDAGGVNRIRSAPFLHYGQPEGLPSDIVYGMTEDSENGVWIGSEGGATGILTEGISPIPLEDDIISAATTPDGSLWFGTYARGIVQIDGETRKMWGADQGLPDLSVYALHVDSDGVLWAGTGGGIVRWRNGRFELYTPADVLAENQITSIVGSDSSDLWVGTFDNGVTHLHERGYRRYGEAEGLSHESVLSLYQDARGTVWVGTWGDGLNRIEAGEVASMPASTGIPAGVFAIVEDRQERLWMSSNKGLYAVPRTDLEALATGSIATVSPSHVDKADGLRSREFNGGFQPPGMLAADGRLWFPSDRGAVSFDPDEVLAERDPPHVVVHDAVSETGIWSGYQTPTMPPGTRRLSIRFSSLTFVAQERVRFQYRVDGLDSDWINGGDRREINYSGLKPGVYLFRVRAHRAGSERYGPEAQYRFTLEPYFWQTDWFVGLCFLLTFLLAYGGYRWRIRSLRTRELELEATVEQRTRDLRLEKERTEEAKQVIEAQADKLQELDRFKTRFFANVSHEFRTPLTMILGPLENALEGIYGSMSDEMGRQVDIMRRNALRLMRLINQLLDLSKLEAGKMTLRARPRNIGQFVLEITETFSAFAEQKGVALTCLLERDDMPLFYEPDKMEKVVVNLLSNAIKFTPPGGEIGVSVSYDEQGEEAGHLLIRVRDTGKGIPAEDLPHVFDRFHQVDGSNTREQEGTGIGLALVRELVLLHHGSIDLSSEPGRGTEFVISLPTGRAHLKDEQIADGTIGEAGPRVSEQYILADGTKSDVVEEAAEENKSGGTLQQAVPAHRRNHGVPAPTGPPEDAPLVLVVDDNADVREYVSSILGARYRIECAADGREGWERAQTLHPSLVVSDVQMPHMDGNELCRLIKQHESLHLTPVILLTARASSESRITGLEVGADDYMAKPFNARELLARVRNLLALRSLTGDLRNANDALRLAIETKSQFLRIAAHDLKSPLHIIKGYTNLLQEELEHDPALSGHLGSVDRAIDQMTTLIQQLLDSAALESGRVDPTFEQVNLRELVAEVVDLYRSRATEKRQTIRLSCAEAIHAVIDRGQVGRAVDNLVSNAVKYSPPDREIFVAVEPAGLQVRIRVRDQGPGLTEQDRRLAFGRFQRLSARPTGNESSTGLGLFIVKQIVRMHGGTVWVNSEPGAGAEFGFELPVDPEVTAADPARDSGGRDDASAAAHHDERRRSPLQGLPEPSADPPHAARDATLVLIVDDNERDRTLLEAALQPAYRVRTVDSAARALEVIEEDAPDVIVSDVLMPGMDGTELCRLLRANERTRHIGMILLTEGYDDDRRLALLEMGADDYLTKPVNKRELMARLSNLVRLRQMNRRLTEMADQVDERVATQVETIISGRHSFERELIEARDEAQAVSILKSSILNNLSHEFRSPVTTILGQARMIEKEGTCDAAPFARTIRESAERLVATMDSVLELAAFDPADVVARFKRMSLRSAVEPVIGDHQERAHQKGLTFSWNPEYDAHAHIDAGAVQRVASAILDNAIKFTEHGTIDVTLTRCEAGVALTVRDTGAGMSPEYLPDLFTPFVQESRGLSRAHEGPGIGLALARSLADAMHATIDVRTTQGEGTEVRVVFPVELAGGADDRPAQANRSAGTSSRTRTGRTGRESQPDE